MRLVIAKNALIFVTTGRKLCVPGAQDHRTTASFTLRQISKAKYDAINAKRYSLNWNQFLLLVKKCQHWAEKVLP